MIDKLIVKSIRWDRIYLHVEFEQIPAYDAVFYISNKKQKEQYRLEHKNNSICINITKVSDERNKEMLFNGNWEILCFNSDKKPIDIVIDSNVALALENLDKVFTYGRYETYAYVVTLRPEEIGTNVKFVIHVSYMLENKKPHKEYVFSETKQVKERVKRQVVILVEKIYRILYNLLCKFRKKDGRHILLMSETKNQIDSNLKRIDSRMRERGLNHKYILSYSFGEILHMSSVQVAVHWLKLIVILAKQDFVIVDDYVPIFKFLKLDKKTKLIQVWHAGVGFKSVGYSRFGKKDSPWPLDSCHRNYDYAVVGSKSLIPVYEEVFGIHKEKILPLGVPRVDSFIDEKHVNRYQQDFYERYPQLKDKRIILFAPTYRGAGQEEAYYPYEQLELSKIYEVCGNDAIFAFKMHPFIKKNPEIPECYNNRIFDFSNENINDILSISEILITDYSSVIYEYVLMDKPILFYAFDKEMYNAVRGFHWDFEQYAPGLICETFEQLLGAMTGDDISSERREVFKKFAYEHIDSKATDRFIDFFWN